jgi:hypothetical protein
MLLHFNIFLSTQLCEKVVLFHPYICQNSTKSNIRPTPDIANELYISKPIQVFLGSYISHHTSIASTQQSPHTAPGCDKLEQETSKIHSPNPRNPRAPTVEVQHICISLPSVISWSYPLFPTARPSNFPVSIQYLIKISVDYHKSSWLQPDSPKSRNHTKNAQSLDISL